MIKPPDWFDVNVRQLPHLLLKLNCVLFICVIVLYAIKKRLSISFCFS